MVLFKNFLFLWYFFFFFFEKKSFRWLKWQKYVGTNLSTLISLLLQAKRGGKKNNSLPFCSGPIYFTEKEDRKKMKRQEPMRDSFTLPFMLHRRRNLGRILRQFISPVIQAKFCQSQWVYFACYTGEMLLSSACPLSPIVQKFIHPFRLYDWRNGCW